MTIKVRVISHLPGVYPSCQPEIGKVYEAHYKPAKAKGNGNVHYAPVCVIDVNGKKICLKPNEYEILGE